jgi:hypothetical protein
METLEFYAMADISKNDLLSRLIEIRLAERIARRIHNSHLVHRHRRSIGHIENMVYALRDQFNVRPVEISAAWLCDSLVIGSEERWSTTYLTAEGIHPDTLAIIEEITPNSDMNYIEWIKSLAKTGSIEAVHVKFIDHIKLESTESCSTLPSDDNSTKSLGCFANHILMNRINAAATGGSNTATFNFQTYCDP